MQNVLARTVFLVSAAMFGIASWNAARVAAHEKSRAEQKATQNAQVERGKYLVEKVAMCFECHTPRKANGDIDQNAWLQGAPIWILPVKPIAGWAQNVPPLAGLPSLTEEEGERVLEKGEGPEGEVLRPPMHIYHMKPDDAKAIIAYLKSLPIANH
jgi:mono/diheme cytochrome c family protein